MHTANLIANRVARLSMTALLMASPQFAQALGEIDVSEASSCVGRVCTIEGLVVHVVTTKDQNTVIQLAGSSPSQVFSAVILADACPQFHALENFEGQKVRITGLVKMHGSAPEAVLVHPSQLLSAE
jgi:hypothetical protein